MKKIIFLSFLLIIVLSNFAESVVFTLDDEELKVDQTLIGKIEGVFTSDISSDNILVYRNDKRVPFDFSIKKLQDVYYIYTNLEGKSPGNYTIKIQDVSYLQNGRPTSEDILKNFSISNETTDFSLSPGIIETDKEFYINVKNKAEKELKVGIKINQEDDESREVLFYDNEETYDNEDITLKIGETKVLKFVVGDYGTSGFYSINFKSENTEYNLPVYVLIDPNHYESNKMSWQYTNLVFNNLKAKETNKEVIKIINLGSEDIGEVSFSVSESLKDYIKVLNQTIDLKEKFNDIHLEIKSDNVGEVQGLISAVHDQEITSMSIALSFIGENAKPKNTSSNGTNSGEETTTPKLSCSSFGGILCNYDEECGNGGHREVSKDDDELQFCCVDGECITTKKNSSPKSNIGIILIAILVLIAIIVFTKFKSAKRPIDLLKRKNKKNP